ncbi:MAG TPA: sigma-54 dependent transcriptional regulator [Planctomycetota bacterium]
MEILLVEDERSLAVPLGDALREAGHRVTVLYEGAAALAWLEASRCDLVVTDVRLPGASGVQVMQRARRQDPPADVLMITGYATVEQAVEAMRGGAHSYLQKPFPTEVLLGFVERIENLRAMQAELEQLRGRASDLGGDLGLHGTSAVLEDVRARIRAASRSDATVLVQGESGTGKERAARALHAAGPRARRPFVAVSCAAIPANLLEGELFGYRRGAFTGAEEDRDGRFAQAEDGTLFLDDAHDLPQAAQAALLRALQEREFLPLGARHPQPLRARVVAATRIDLGDAVRAGDFREDLYYRLAVVPLHMPPLRERLEDLPVLVAAFLRSGDPEGRLQVPQETMRRLADHDWPGNVRELENSVTRALALAGRARVLRPEHFLPGGPLAARALRPEDVLPLRESVRRAEREAIRSALAATAGRRAEAATLLGISRKALWQKAKELGLESGAG